MVGTFTAENLTAVDSRKTCLLFTRWHALLALGIGFLCLHTTLPAQEETPAVGRRCEIIPLAEHQVAFQIDGIEKLRWNFSRQFPRPYFFPFYGPSGALLTRMGHPGAPNHDHHQSIWFAHNKVNDLDFWGNEKGTSIIQKRWTCYQDGPDEAVMAVELGWLGPDGKEILQQEVVAAIRPMDAIGQGEYALELQLSFRPADKSPPVTLSKTNFGFLAVRVAKGLSTHFGGGRLSNSEGGIGEQQLFGQSANWVDYSGSVEVGQGVERKVVQEGITYFDHPRNPRYPTKWHVREDGWMGASFNLDEGAQITGEAPLMLRYLLHAHRGVYDAQKARRVADDFAERRSFVVTKSQKPHHQFEVHRQ